MGLIFKKFAVCLETNKDHFDIKKFNHRCKKQTWEQTWGKWEVDWEIGIDIYTILYIK